MTVVLETIALLRAEHRRIDDAAGSLFAWSRELAAGGADRDALSVYLGFLREFISGHHHALEEKVLFPALVEHAEVPADRGPIAVLEADHRRCGELAGAVASAADEMLPERVRELVHHLWEHVDKEETVLLPEAERRLARAAVSELAAPPRSSAAQAAWDALEPLLARWPPADDPEVVRGAGCIACAAFAVTCGGIEKEWWSDWERLYHRSLDEG